VEPKTEDQKATVRTLTRDTIRARAEEEEKKPKRRRKHLRLRMEHLPLRKRYHHPQLPSSLLLLLPCLSHQAIT